jgi:hypothetical protein
MPDPYADLSVKIPVPRFKTSFELIALSAKIFMKCFWFISKIVLVIYLPASLLKACLVPTNNPTHSDDFDTLIDLVFDALITPAVIFGVVQFLKNKTFPSVFDAYRFGWNKWGLVWARTFKSGILMILGFILLIVPGFLACLAYTLVPYAVCFESKTQKSSLRRSRELSIGRRWLIFFSSAIFFPAPSSLCPFYYSR